MNADRRRRGMAVLRHAWPWLLVGVLGGIGTYVMWRYLGSERGAEPIVWKNKRALVMLAGAGLAGVLAFHVHRRNAAALGFSSVGLVGARGAGAWLADVPGVLRVLAIAALAVALAKPETYKTVKHEVDTVDIMLVVDMSKSMEETDMRLDRHLELHAGSLLHPPRQLLRRPRQRTCARLALERHTRQEGDVLRLGRGGILQGLQELLPGPAPARRLRMVHRVVGEVLMDLEEDIRRH